MRTPYLDTNGKKMISKLLKTTKRGQSRSDHNACDLTTVRCPIVDQKSSVSNEKQSYTVSVETLSNN